ncbi:DUF397 domain-containing protein [Actinokineospora guangxiensis]|uniref:DUF397 domain-containing protein n=1 Tax=Actinokineospora guangxiensis TaxID=1490288 RepID=A0ABW0EEG4_9PSEU
MASYEQHPLPQPRAWRRGSASAANGNCVEVAPDGPGWLVRDSKNTGPELAFPAPAWAALLSRAGRPRARPR